MTNLQKHKSTIIDFLRVSGDTPAFINNHWTVCESECEKCLFHLRENDEEETCVEKFIEWCAEECED